MELKVIPNNCFCREVCAECHQWFDCGDLIAFEKVTEKSNEIICPDCFLKLQEDMRNEQATAMFGVNVACETHQDGVESKLG